MPVNLSNARVLHYLSNSSTMLACYMQCLHSSIQRYKTTKPFRKMAISTTTRTLTLQSIPNRTYSISIKISSCSSSNSTFFTNTFKPLSLSTAGHRSSILNTKKEGFLGIVCSDLVCRSLWLLSALLPLFLALKAAGSWSKYCKTVKSFQQVAHSFVPGLCPCINSK